MSDRKEDAISKVRKIWEEKADKARSEMITQINKEMYQDELTHKRDTYDNVKAALKVNLTMIKALEPTTSKETDSRFIAIHHLEMATTYCMLAAVDVDLELRGLGK